MYLSFYNLAQKPFQITTDPHFLWWGEKHREALANLKYGLLESNGFVVLTGDVGTGKTTLINALLESIDERIIVTRVSHPSLDTDAFLNFIARKYDPSVTAVRKNDLLHFFETFLQKAHAEGRIVLLIIDEAHRLPPEVFEEIRLLSNIEAEGRRLINIIFVGQDELKPLIYTPEHRALRQRITLFYEISLLSQGEIPEYVNHRLKVAGSQQGVFTQAAFREIYQFSKGCPRLINLLCDRALLTGYIQERRLIDADIIIECTKELEFQQPPADIHEADTPEADTPEADSPEADSLEADTPEAHPPEVAQYAKQSDWRQSIVSGLRRRQVALRADMGSAAAKLSGAFQTAAKHLVSAAKHRKKEKNKATYNTFSLFLKKNPRQVILVGGITAVAAISLLLSIGEEPRAKITQEEVPSVQSTSANGNDVGDQSVAEILPHKVMGGDQSDPAPGGTQPDPNRVTTASGTSTEPTTVSSDTLEQAQAAMTQKNYQAAIDLLEKADAGNNPKVGQLYSQALVAKAGKLLSTDPHQAETLLKQAVKANPDNAEAHFMLGNQFRQAENFASAIDAYRHAIHLKPDHTDAFYNLGYCYDASGMYQAAEIVFMEVVRLKPAYLGKALFNLAVVQQKLGKKRQSLENLEKAAVLLPEDTKVLAYLNKLKAAP
jgi:type II secretory pathway predicted ATPase ExeA/cytochrome c-type biogenesis protein CcmH/NrfG